MPDRPVEGESEFRKALREHLVKVLVLITSTALVGLLAGIGAVVYEYEFTTCLKSYVRTAGEAQKFVRPKSVAKDDALEVIFEDSEKYGGDSTRVQMDVNRFIELDEAYKTAIANHPIPNPPWCLA